MNDDVKDELLSRTYRESAIETAPDALNHAVLKEARRAASSRYSRNVHWLRPMAWAATVGLCLAIVVELSNVPQPDSSFNGAPGADAVDSLLLDSARDNAPAAASEPARQQDSPAAPAARLAPSSDAAAPAKAEGGDALAKSTPADDLAFAIESTPVIEEARALARMREGDNVSELPENEAHQAGEDLAAAREDDRAAGPEQYAASDSTGESKRGEIQAFASAAAPALEAVVDAPCDARARATPDAWLECIEGLETDGHDDIAREQRELLQAAFPEFAVPAERR